MNVKFSQGDLFNAFFSSSTETMSFQNAFGNMQKNKRRMLCPNLDVNHTFSYDSRYDIPILAPYNGPVPKKIIPYKAISNASYQDCPCFYMNDSEIPLFQNNIEHYTNRLSKFKYVIAPDHSMYCGAPLPVNLQSLYVNRSVAAYWQEHGLNVIPSFNGGDAKTFDYCLSGMPKNSIIATGNIGVSHSSITQRLWVALVEMAIRELEPTALIIYGTKIDFKYSKDLPVYWHDDFKQTGNANSIFLVGHPRF